MRTLVMGLGNELVADDAVGIVAAQVLRQSLAGRADVCCSSMHGLALLDLFIGYQRAIVLDAMKTGRHPPGTVVEIDGAELSRVSAPSPHYSGLPEMLDLARELELEFPRQVTIFGVEADDLQTLGGAMTPAVQRAIPELCRRVVRALDE